MRDYSNSELIQGHHEQFDGCPYNPMEQSTSRSIEALATSHTTAAVGAVVAFVFGYGFELFGDMVGSV